MNSSSTNKSKYRKQRSVRHGRTAEWLAAIYLICKGYKILKRGYRTRSGEIDIIAAKGKLLAIIEVKYRHDLQSAINAVNPYSQRRIADAADIYLTSRKDFAELSLRFDIIAMMPWKWPRHFKDAF